MTPLDVGIDYYNNGLFRKSIDCLQEFVAFERDSSLAFFYLGLSQGAEYQYREALDSFAEAKRLGSNDGAPDLVSANILISLKQKDNARLILTNLLGHPYNEDIVLEANAWLSYLNEDYTTCIEQCEEIMDADIEKTPPPECYLSALILAHQFKKAKGFIIDYWDLFVAKSEYFYGLGLCEEQLGNNEEAIHAYEQTLTLYRNHLTCRRRLTRLYLYTGRFKKFWENAPRVIQDEIQRHREEMLSAGTNS